MDASGGTTEERRTGVRRIDDHSRPVTVEAFANGAGDRLAVFEKRVTRAERGIWVNVVAMIGVIITLITISFRAGNWQGTIETYIASIDDDIDQHMVEDDARTRALATGVDELNVTMERVLTTQRLTQQLLDEQIASLQRRLLSMEARP